MFDGMPLENTPDFEYVFEDTVRLPEFDLYHIGLGLYRFEQPLDYNEKDFRLLTEKYHYLTFFYENDRDDSIILLFVMSSTYNITNFEFMDNALRNNSFAKLIPKGYYERIDDERIHTSIKKSQWYFGNKSEMADGPNMLLGFQWVPGQYYDGCGRRRYIMINGSVAKLIATGVYAFQNIQSNERYHEGRERYPLIGEKIYEKEFKRCAVVGRMTFDGGRISTYSGTRARYIAFDDTGIAMLKILYQYTIGYEYKELEVITKNDGIVHKNNLIDIFPLDPSKLELGEWEQREEKRKILYQNHIGAHAIELIPGIGYRDIAVYIRILFHEENKIQFRPRKYDFVYIEDGILKLVDISGNDTKVYSVPIRVLAELSVVRKLEICYGVRDDILIKVIDNTSYEKDVIGMDNYENFRKFLKYY